MKIKVFLNCYNFTNILAAELKNIHPIFINEK
jgi:hypothetical protein